MSVMRSIIMVSLLVTLSACGGGDGMSANTGRVSLAITDAPVEDAAAVVVQFSGIAFKREGAAPETVHTFTPSPRSLDLLEYQQGRTAVLLDGITLTAGHYEWIRLIVDNQAAVRDSYVTLKTGEECELRVPSGAESGLKLNRGFDLPADGSVALTIDFDLQQSLHAPPGQHSLSEECTQGYLLRPTLRIVDNANVGAIAGTVDSTLVGGTCLPKVYIYSGAGVVPDDIEENGAAGDVDPLVVASVEIRNGDTAYSYRAAFLPPGSYTVAFTCGDDDPANDDVLTFLTAQTATVQNNLIAPIDWTPPAP